jgi:hypothetical protein
MELLKKSSEACEWFLCLASLLVLVAAVLILIAYSLQNPTDRPLTAVENPFLSVAIIAVIGTCLAFISITYNKFYIRFMTKRAKRAAIATANQPDADNPKVNLNKIY